MSIEVSKVVGMDIDVKERRVETWLTVMEMSARWSKRAEFRYAWSKYL